MNTNQKVIDWLVDNDQLVLEMVNKTMEQIKDVDKEFMDEARNQQQDEIRKMLVDEMSMNIGLTFEDFESSVSEEMLSKYIQEIKG